MIKCLPGHTWLWVTAWKRENKMGPQANDFQVCWPSCLATGEWCRGQGQCSRAAKANIQDHGKPSRARDPGLPPDCIAPCGSVCLHLPTVKSTRLPPLPLLPLPRFPSTQKYLPIPSLLTWDLLKTQLEGALAKSDLQGTGRESLHCPAPGHAAQLYSLYNTPFSSILSPGFFGIPQMFSSSIYRRKSDPKPFQPSSAHTHFSGL